MWLWNFADSDSPKDAVGVVDSTADQAEKAPTPEEIKKYHGSQDAYQTEEDTPVAIEEHEAPDALEVMLPWFTALMIHLAIIVLAIFAAWSFKQVLSDDEKKVVIPIARMAEQAGGALSETQDVQMQETQNVREVQSEQVSTDSNVQTLDTNLDNTIDLVGASGGGGGALSAFGQTQGGSGGLETKFYGIGGNARKILYIIDASGSLIDTLPFVIKELKESLGTLSDEQQFTVIFFQDGDPIEVPPIGWKTANAESKQKTYEWIDLDSGNVVPRGRTDPKRALTLAMRYKPELMFILSDNITGKGQWEVNREDLLKFLNDQNRARSTAINTIQFIDPDPLDTLKTIAQEHGGVYKFVRESDLGLK